MAKVYANLIVNGKYSYDKVRTNLKPDVLKELRKYVDDGTITIEKFKELTGEMYK